MISFINPSKEKPFLLIKEKYHGSIKKKSKKYSKPISISSYSKTDSLVDSRYVNLKFIDGEDFIFSRIMNHLNLNNLKNIIRFQH